MSPSRSRTFRVFLHTWEVYETTVTARSPEHAEAIARRIHEAQGTDGFCWFNGGDDGFQIEDWEGV